MLFVFIYTYRCPTRFPYQMMFVLQHDGCHMEKVLTLPEHLEFTPSFKWGSCCSIFYFLCNVLQIVFVVSVLRFTASDDPFGIFKLFFRYRYLIVACIEVEKTNGPSERNHRLPTRQKREEKKFSKYVCVRTRQSGDRTS